jgi:hypothetical protein
MEGAHGRTKPLTAKKQKKKEEEGYSIPQSPATAYPH